MQFCPLMRVTSACKVCKFAQVQLQKALKPAQSRSAVLSAKRVAPARRNLDTTSFQQRRGDLQQWRIAAAAKASHLPSLCSLLSTAGA